MTDRELLELAAKAAGAIDDRTSDSTSPGIHIGEDGATYQILENDGGWKPWNPLNDDGDALRLAVKLSLDFEWWKNGVSVGHTDIPPMPIEYCNDDPYAATRRAIVRAAAEIGLTQDKAR